MGAGGGGAGGLGRAATGARSSSNGQGHTQTHTRKRTHANHCAIACSARLNPAVRETFSGHAEFDIVLEAASADAGDVVWQAVLTLVLMNPKKSKGHGGGGAKKVRVCLWGVRFTSPTPSNTDTLKYQTLNQHRNHRQEAEKPAEPAAEALDSWQLGEDAGRKYAALDGDISPMHLYK